jgi:hypothetical protein
MGAQGSVLRWLDPLRVGDSAAVQQLWERYFRRLVGLARHQLSRFSSPRRACTIAPRSPARPAQGQSKRLATSLLSRSCGSDRAW